MTPLLLVAAASTGFPVSKPPDEVARPLDALAGVETRYTGDIMTCNKIREDGNSVVLSVSSGANRAGLELDDEMEIDGLHGMLIAGHVVDSPSGRSELSEEEFRELTDVLVEQRVEQLKRD